MAKIMGGCDLVLLIWFKRNLCFNSKSVNLDLPAHSIGVSREAVPGPHNFLETDQGTKVSGGLLQKNIGLKSRSSNNFKLRINKTEDRKSISKIKFNDF